MTRRNRGAEKLGRKLASMDNRITSLEQSSGPSANTSNLLIKQLENLVLSEEINLTKFDICDDAFVLDHPEHGELDSSQYKLDKGYCEATNIRLDTNYEFISSS